MFGSIDGLNLDDGGFQINGSDELSSHTYSNLCQEGSEYLNWPIIETYVPGYDSFPIHFSSGLFEFSQNVKNETEDIGNKEVFPKYLDKRSAQKEVIFEIQKCPKLLLKKEVNKSILQDITERLVLFLKKIPERDTIDIKICDLIDRFDFENMQKGKKHFLRRLYDVLNVLEGIRYKSIDLVIKKRSGKVSYLGSIAKKILIKICNDVSYEEDVVYLEEIKKKFGRRTYDVMQVFIGLGMLEHSSKNLYVIKDKDIIEELYNDFLNG